MPEQGHAWGNGLETQKRKGRLKREGSFARTRTARLMAGLAERIGGEESSEEAWICWNSMLRKRINLYPCSLAVQFVNRGYVHCEGTHAAPLGPNDFWGPPDEDVEILQN